MTGSWKLLAIQRLEKRFVETKDRNENMNVRIDGWREIGEGKNTSFGMDCPYSYFTVYMSLNIMQALDKVIDAECIESYLHTQVVESAVRECERANATTLM